MGKRRKRTVKGNDIPGVDFMHLRMSVDGMCNRGPACSFAFRIQDGELQAGLALCSPEDNFSRPKAWLISRGRLLSTKPSPYRLTLPFVESGDKGADREAARAILRGAFVELAQGIPRDDFRCWWSRMMLAAHVAGGFGCPRHTWKGNRTQSEL